MAREVTHMAVCAGVLEQRAKHFACIHLIWVADNHFYAERFRAGLHHCNVLRMTVAVYKESLRL